MKRATVILSIGFALASCGPSVESPPVSDEPVTAAPSSVTPTTFTPATAASSASPTAAAPESELPTLVVSHQGSDGEAITIALIDQTGRLIDARGAIKTDGESRVEGPEILPVLGSPNQLRVLWVGGVCDTRYRVVLTLNSLDALHFDVVEGQPSNPSCDLIPVRRGVVITFDIPVDAQSATAAMHRFPP